MASTYGVNTRPSTTSLLLHFDLRICLGIEYRSSGDEPKTFPSRSLRRPCSCIMYWNVLSLRRQRRLIRGCTVQVDQSAFSSAKNWGALMSLVVSDEGKGFRTKDSSELSSSRGSCQGAHSYGKGVDHSTHVAYEEISPHKKGYPSSKTLDTPIE